MTILLDAPWAVWTVVLPLAAAILTFLAPRYAAHLSVATGLGVMLSAAGLAWQVVRQGPQRYSIGGWGAPLGIDLYADGLSVLMLLMTATVEVATSLYAAAYLSPAADGEGQAVGYRMQARVYFWPLWMFLWTALNALFLSADLFNLYVTLELLGLSAVALVALAGQSAALVAAMRYLLVSLLGSLSYLLGVALVYATYGSLDLVSLGQVISPSPMTWAAMALMTAGLVLKTALFPMHFWLPPAHANAPAPVSAILSALVVKASFYLLLRLWFEVFATAVTPLAAQFLGGLGAAAILWGSFQALLAPRLKLLVAYSTVAQLGYLFLVFPLAQTAATAFVSWSAAAYLMVSHACAKAAMFLVAGTVLHAAGHDRVGNLDGIWHRLPVSVFAFALAGVSIMGLPPSGGFVAKWMLLNAALTGGHWWWLAVIVVGGLLSAGYIFRVLSCAFAQRQEPAGHELAPVPRLMEASALFLSLVAIALGVIASQPLTLLRIGAPANLGVLAGTVP